MKKIISILIALALVGLISFKNPKIITAQNEGANFWQIQSIDTMKYSRDLAREKLKDATFDKTIEDHVGKIADTGATHVVVASPYDDEFIPYISRWVLAARKYKLNVWFRGNLSGWEGWFGYHKISNEEHTNQIYSFITNNPELFADGDIFTSCPECENGGEGDPRHNGQAKEFREFLIKEYGVTREAFKKINKNVRSNLYSMNGDVAELIMDRDTTKALGGVITVDHYVEDPKVLVKDLVELAKKSGGKVVLGEFGVPVPDIHGSMTQEEQSIWLEKFFTEALKFPEIIGINYWVSFGGSTELWKSGGEARSAVEVIKKYFKPNLLEVKILNEINSPVVKAAIEHNGREYLSSDGGVISLPYISDSEEIKVTANGYNMRLLPISEVQETGKIVLKKNTENLYFRLLKMILSLLSRLDFDFNL